MHRTLFLILVGLLLAAPAAGQEAATPQIAGHEMVIGIVPEQHLMSVQDVVLLDSPSPGEFSFTLNRNLSIDEVKFESAGGDEAVEFETLPYEGPGAGEVGETETLQTVRLLLPEGATRFRIVYGGEIYDPIDPSTALGRVRGDYTSGIISPEGVYLSSESGWYPDTEKSMATYSLIVSVPEAWSVVTQGSRRALNLVQGINTTSWYTDIPSDGCVLVANEYHIRSRTIAGVECSTYFYEDDEELSNGFLDKLEEYLPAYVGLFGPFPYSRFDVVENFFTTGYGMPGFTLLGSRVLRMPYATAEGSLAHELVHNWWGNYLFVDWEKGNWCEGLTYFSTNYYWNILDGRPEDAEHFRFRSMVRYSVEVGDEEDYPVREFRTKMTAEDGDIGYDKSGFVFIMLEKMLGEDSFFEALKLVVQRHGGQRATWDDLRAAFEEVSGTDLSGFFSSWLDNAGTPKIAINDPDLTETGGGYLLEFEVAQEGQLFEFILPVVLGIGDWEGELPLPIDSASMPCEFALDGAVDSMSIDPHHYVFRRLTRDEIPPSLNTTLEADSVLVVVPSGGEADMLEVASAMGHGGPGGGTEQVSVRDHYQGIADSIVQSGVDVTIKPDDEVTDEDLENSSIICFGAPAYNSLLARIAGDLPNTLVIQDDGFSVNGNEYLNDGAAILVTVRNPYNSGYDITFYFGNSPQSIARASYIFFYGWDSWVVYENGNAVDRGEWDMGKGPLHFGF